MDLELNIIGFAYTKSCSGINLLHFGTTLVYWASTYRPIFNSFHSDAVCRKRFAEKKPILLTHVIIDDISSKFIVRWNIPFTLDLGAFSFKTCWATPSSSQFKVVMSCSKQLLFLVSGEDYLPPPPPMFETDGPMRPPIAPKPKSGSAKGGKAPGEKKRESTVWLKPQICVFIG